MHINHIKERKKNTHIARIFMEQGRNIRTQTRYLDVSAIRNSNRHSSYLKGIPVPPVVIVVMVTKRHVLTVTNITCRNALH